MAERLQNDGAKRASALPELPTMIEAGVPGYVADAWFGLVMPAGTPKAIIERMNAEGQKAAMIQDEFKRWGPIVKASGAKVD